MAVGFGTTFQQIATDATVDLNLTPSAAVGIGTVLLIGTTRATQSGAQNGVNAITADTNTASVNICHAARASTLDTGGHHVVITDALEATAGEVEIDFKSTIGNRKAAVGLPVTGIATAVHTASVGALGLGETSVGSNGSSTTISGGSLTTTIANCLLVAYVGFGATSNTIASVPSGWTLRGSVGTTFGSSDRNIAILTREVSTAGTYSLAGATLSASAGWTVALAAYEITNPAPIPFRFVWTGTQLVPVERTITT